MRSALFALAALLVLPLVGCAASKHSEPPPHWDSAEVVPFQTSTALVTGLDGPAEPYGRQLAIKIAETLTEDGIPATVVSAPTPGSGKLVIEGRFVELDAGNRAARWALWMFGAGVVKVTIEGRASGDQLPSPGLFKIGDKGRGGAFGGDWQKMVNESFEMFASDIARMAETRDFAGTPQGDLVTALDQARAASTATAIPASPAQSKDIETRLNDLKRMYDNKVITREEYEAERKRILGES